ncbi:RNA polymerase sigma-70 factor (ECF subfamily) [Chitinophaga polysaccharea]|uniref:RNA polymerase sigma-70 factor (ECF subfamily) n=1 Tax=Chitinophaga polysaccharea TaxID=1293035 RepID=A0A561P3T3_9BACT|nr:sigma-70 family RNA polymerase sigma factor [Chitinophaga polysaccharea]TWF32754.1 RNA polymerase sigma-70 factor (ECF subfamily) [Chitinophaga polysaccharea]
MYSSHTDEQLVALLANGDESAFNEIYNRYWKWLLFIAHKRLRDTEAAREVIQQVFLNLWHKRNRIMIASLPQYLAAMARHAVYRHLANEGRRQEVQTSAMIQAESSEAFDLDNKQLLEILVKYAHELPAKFSILFIHHKLMDKPLEEVAEELGVSPRTAERYIGEVMKIMRNKLRALRTAIFTTFPLW